MKKDFANQVAIITGAGQGIGLEVARALTTQGAAVVLNDINATLTERACQAITSEGGKCIGVSGDAGELKGIQNLVDSAVKQFGQLTLCIPNAGITLFDNFLNF